MSGYLHRHGVRAACSSRVRTRARKHARAHARAHAHTQHAHTLATHTHKKENAEINDIF